MQSQFGTPAGCQKISRGLASVSKRNPRLIKTAAQRTLKGCEDLLAPFQGASFIWTLPPGLRPLPGLNPGLKFLHPSGVHLPS